MTREPRLDLTNTRKAGDSGAARFLRREKRKSINFRFIILSKRYVNYYARYKTYRLLKDII